MSKKRVLVYGFKPFLQYTENITESIVTYLESDDDVFTHVFPVRFDKQLFLNQVNKVKPDAILGLGQDSRARKIRIERKAINAKKETQEATSSPISSKGAAQLFCYPPVKKLPGTTVTYDAGQYVCNYSMYVFLEHCTPKDIPYIFLHIPLNANIRDAVKTVRRIKGDLQQAVLSK